MSRWDSYVSQQGFNLLLKSKPFQFTFALFDFKLTFCLQLIFTPPCYSVRFISCVWKCISAMPVTHTITKIRSVASLCSSRLQFPLSPFLPTHHLHRHFFFSTTASPPFIFSFLSLSQSVSPSFSLSPSLWLAVSLGLCTFLAGKSEALSKHQLPRSAQRNPTWLSLRCRPPLLTPPLSS